MTPPKGSAELTGMNEIVSSEARQRKLLTPRAPPDQDITLESLDPGAIDYSKRNTVFGQGGLNIFGSSDEPVRNSGGALGVNSFLWRASLDIISFMPVNSADPFGGVIITD